MSEIQFEDRPHYVYVLIDPEVEQIFYVGKGVDRRAFDHLEEALDTTSNAAKVQRIDQIKARGLEPVVRVIGRYRESAAAFAVEAVLIKWVYGMDQLTNIQPGHGSSTVRRKLDLSELPGLDIPRRTSASRDGVYSQSKLEARDEHGIIDLMTELGRQIEADTSVPFPGLSTKRKDRTRIYYEMRGITLRLGAPHSPTGNVVLGIENHELPDAEFTRLCKQAGFEMVGKEPFSNAKLSDFRQSNNLDLVVERFIEAKRLIEVHFPTRS